MKKHISDFTLISMAFLFLIIIIASAFFPAYVFGFDPDSESPWHIVADKLLYNNKTDTYTAEGNVIVTSDKSKIQSDFIEYNTQKMNAFARGHVVVTSEGDTSYAEKMSFNLKSEKGTLHNGTIFIQSSHLYIKGDKIEKTGDKSYKADKVSITTCDGDSPDWKITGRNLKVTIEGYGTVFHSAFWAKKVPLLYSPFFLFPVKIKRQTGFLPPTITFASERKGYEYFQPFFWAINDSMDSTLYYRHMQKRGSLLGTEYRYILSEQAKGAVFYDYLKDRQIDDGSEEATDNWGYTDGGNRENEKRYWFRMKHDQLLLSGISMKLNADVVSDPDYLREFDDMKNGFKATKKYFNKNFGSDLEASDDKLRTNSLLFNKNWTSYSLNGELYWYDNISARREDTKDYTLQKLPLINFSGSKQQFLNTPLYFDLESEYSYFFRPDTKAKKYKGHRADIFPHLYLPLKLKNWLSIEPSMGFRKTLWHVENDFGPKTSINESSGEVIELISETEREIKGGHTRYLYESGLEISSDLFKIYNLNFGKTDKIKHSMIPKIVWHYIPEVDQEDYPSFDAVDRIEKKNTVTFSITNYLTGRSIIKAARKKDGSFGKTEYSYNRFCRLDLSQEYDINEKNENTPENWRNGETKEEFYPLKIELDITPYRYFSLDSDWEWSKYQRGMIKANIDMSINDKRGDSIGAEYRYTRDEIESVITKASVALTKNISVSANNEYDSLLKEHIETNAGIKYQSQCWSINIQYTDKPDERKYTFVLTLLGLGDFKNNVGAGEIEDAF